ncbi:HAD family hydrolase [Mycolicibacterium smegmatis]|uniref:HAD family hydrolase n=1 Tax=Mycolicibacterium smegmatis TaxID=1772 RepID=UPI001E4081BE|nr:HAD family hydrolase [Mycolicibacterium smegmatis]MCP2623515.1 HAD family hydrolase [Mycolicibacterium smegmatis]UGU31009.1 HAD family hydrolase [Mycolicibacterium smegmatis]ULN36818.1 HAD family hydrolase [Mycolicibacterium smegmatis]ULN71915.1 HAD family hydrolase [Mycolicibacterium smegmatis]
MTSHKTFPIAGILFDSDGVLVDSHEAAAKAWNHWARTWAPGFDFHRDAQHGRRLSDVVAELVGDGDSALATKVLTELEIEMATEVPAMAGAVDLLSSSPADRWAVVTSGGREMAAARLLSAGLPTPRVLVSADDVTAGKPAPEPYLTGAHLLGLEPRVCAVFEDAHLGILAARAANVGFVVGVGAQTIGEDVDVSVADLSGITFDGSHLVIEADAVLTR